MLDQSQYNHISLSLKENLFLFDSGAHVNNHDWTGSTPLFDAVKNGHIGVVRVLIEHSADLNLPTTKGISPLLGMFACVYITIDV